MTKRTKALATVVLGTVFILGALVWFQYEYSKWEEEKKLEEENPVHRYFNDPEYKQRVDAAVQQVYEKAGYRPE